MAYRHIVVKQLTLKELKEEHSYDTALDLYLSGRVWAVYNTGMKTIISEVYHIKANAETARERLIDEWVYMDADMAEY